MVRVDVDSLLMAGRADLCARPHPPGGVVLNTGTSSASTTYAPANAGVTSGMARRWHRCVSARPEQIRRSGVS